MVFFNLSDGLKFLFRTIFYNILRFTYELIINSSNFRISSYVCLAVCSKTSREMPISPTKYHNPINTIRVGFATGFTAK